MVQLRYAHYYHTISVGFSLYTPRRGGGVLGCPWPPTPRPFCELFLSKQPTTGGENDMTIWWVPSIWHTVTPPPRLKNPGYAPVKGQIKIISIFIDET